MDLPLENTSTKSTNVKLLNGVLTKQQWIFLEKPLVAAEKHIASALIEYASSLCKTKTVSPEDTVVLEQPDGDQHNIEQDQGEQDREQDRDQVIEKPKQALTKNIVCKEDVLLDEWDSPEIDTFEADNCILDMPDIVASGPEKTSSIKKIKPIIKKNKNKKTVLPVEPVIKMQPNTDLFALGEIYNMWRLKFGNEKLNCAKIEAKFNVDKETKGMKQADKIQYEVLHKQYFDTLNDVLKFLQQDDIMITDTDDISHNIFKYNVVEITGIALMKLAKCILAHVGYHKKKISGYKIALTVMTTMQRFIHVVPSLLCAEYKRTKNIIKVSDLMLNDLIYWFNTLKGEIVYNMERVSKYAPILFH